MSLDQESNPLSAEQKHQSLSLVFFSEELQVLESTQSKCNFASLHPLYYKYDKLTCFTVSTSEFLGTCTFCPATSKGYACAAIQTCYTRAINVYMWKNKVTQ